MTIQAPLRPRSGGRAPVAAAELLLPVLTVVSGLQLLRLMVSTVVGVYRDRLGAPLAGLALFAGCVVALGFLAAPAARLLGRSRALVVSAAGVALVRLALQLVPDAIVRWLLAPVGVVLFLWFVPLWLRRDGRGFGLALLAGLAADTALAGLFGSWDYAWSITGWTVALAAALAGAALWALARLPGPDRVGTPDRRLAAVLPLAGIGPALFLHALVWQNLGWQAVLGGRSPLQAFALVMVADLAALAVGTAVALAGEARSLVVVAALAGLGASVLLAGEAAVAAGLLGQAAAAVLVVVIVRRATEPAPGGSPDPERRDGLARVAAACTAGMGLFILLVFGYYAAYDMVLPVGNRMLLFLAAGLLGLAAAIDRWVGGERTLSAEEPHRAAGAAGRVGVGDGAAGRLGVGAEQAERRARPGRGELVPVGVGIVLLLAPVLAWVGAPDPVPAQPVLPGAAGAVRVLSYNLHFGFDVRGWSDLEGVARAIEATGAEVVGLQEVSRGWYVNGSTDMLGWLQRRLRMPHARFAGASDAIWGNAVLSRYPIVGGEVVRLPREGMPLARSALRVALDLGAGRRLDVVVTHLHHVEGPDGARVRLAQLPRLLELAAGRPATVLLGDFNAEPGSAEIALVREAGLTDAFVAGGGGRADELTWPSDRPQRRIDYLWLSPDLAASGFAATDGTASDHRGVAVTVRPAPA
jgi:endonuclease/exonuclease/phosphatase family metal-dependent hydrolase